MFAHNEEQGISATLRSFLRQSIFLNERFCINFTVLANGCTDATVNVCRNIFESIELNNFNIEILEHGGKSRTWNHFVHACSRNDADFLIFCDADIELDEDSTLENLTEYMISRPKLRATSSKPVKDLAKKFDKSLVEKAIFFSSSGLDDWNKSICGQLYMLRAKNARDTWIPSGLPVEDGFVRAMILTKNLTESEDLETIGGDSNLYHTYVSEKSIPSLIRHQVRIVIGSAINTAVFEEISRHKIEDRRNFVRDISQDHEWLANFIENSLPRAPYGFIPFHYLFKRVANFSRRKGGVGAKSVLTLILGFSFDAVVYITAQAKMARGYGANYW